MLSRLYIANGRLPVAKTIRCKVNANEWNDKRNTQFSFSPPSAAYFEKLILLGFIRIVLGIIAALFVLGIIAAAYFISSLVFKCEGITFEKYTFRML